MKNRLIAFAIAFAVSVALPAGAHTRSWVQGHSHGNSGHGNSAHGDHDRDGEHDRDDDRDRAKHDDKDRDRDDRDRDDHRVSSSRPPGWDKGKKTGWGDCDVPPGQVKKLGCHPRSVHHRSDRDRDRRTTRRTDDCHKLGKIESRLPGLPCRDRTSTTTTTATNKNRDPAPPQRKQGGTTTAAGGKVFDDDGTWRRNGGTPPKK